MSTTLTMNNDDSTIKSVFFGLPIFNYSDYKNNIEGAYKRDAALDELKNDLGSNLFRSLSNEDKQFILDTEGSVSFGYKADENDLKRIFSSLKNDYQY